MRASSDDPLAASLRFWPVLLISVVLVALGLGYVARQQSAMWTSTAKVLYGRDSSGLLSGDTSSDNDVNRTLATQAQVVLSDPVMRAAAKKLGVSAQTLSKATTVKDLPDSDVITISVGAPTSAGSVQRTTRVATEYVAYTRAQARGNLSRQADSLQASITKLRKQLATATAAEQGSSSPLSQALSALVQRQGQLISAAEAEEGAASLIAAPQTPTRPSSTSTATAGVVGAGMGLVLGVGLMLLLGRASSSTRRQVRRTTPAQRESGVDVKRSA